MANRFWVGGTASWDGTAGTKWASTSGGGGGVSVPTSVDDVFFTNLSTGTCTIVAGNTGARSINCTGFTGAIGGTVAISVAGSITLSAGMTYTHTGSVTITATATLITAGKTFSILTVNGVGITVTLGDAFTGSGQIIVTQGTFTTSASNYSITLAGSLSSSGSLIRTITLNASTVTLNNSTSAIEFTTATNLTFNAGTSQINCGGLNPILNGGSRTFSNVSFTSTNTGTITGANTFNNLTFNTTASSLRVLVILDTQIVNGTFTCAGSGSIQRAFVRSETLGTIRTITAAAISADDCDFRDITLAGTAAGASPTRAGDCGGNSGITFPAAKTVYWNSAVASNWNSTAWATTPAGTPAVNNFPLAQDTATFTDSGLVAGTVDVVGYNIGTIDASGRTSAMTLSYVDSPTLYGSYTLGSGVTISGTSSLTFSGRGTQTFTSAGKTITFPIIVDKTAGAFVLGDATTTTNSITLTRGTFNAAGYNLTCSIFSSSISTTRTITLGNGLWTLTGTGNPWNVATTTGLTFNKGASDILLTDTSTSSRTFSSGVVGDELTYNKLTIGGTTGISTTTFSGVITFSELASTKTVPHTISLVITGAGRQTFTTWSVKGSAFPVSGFQNILSNSAFSLAQVDVDGYRMNYLVAPDSSISGTTPYYASDNNTSNTTNMILVFRPNTPPSSVTVNSLNNYADAGVLTSPANQTITSGLGTAPLVALALYEQAGGGSITTRSFSPAEDGEVTSGTSRFIKYKIYDSAPANITVGMTSTTGTARGLASFYLQVNGASSVSFLANSTTGVVPTVQAGDIVVSFITVGDASSSIPILVSVSPSNSVILRSSATGTQRAITVTNKTNGIDYLNVRDINAANSAPITFYAGANSINSGNNSNIAFISSNTASPQTAYILTSGTTFTVPADWNSSNNNIYMIGAGAGGATASLAGSNRAAGGGGGGGAFTRLTNFPANAANSVSYVIGTSAAASNGGATTWSSNAFTANGGVRGTSATTPTSAGGRGGDTTAITGIVTASFAGGNGAAGGFGSVASTGYGAGGGGGAGGPNGVGGGGGTGFGSSTAASVAGGGGGGSGGGSNGGNAASALGGKGGNNFGGKGGATTAAGSGTLGGGGAGGQGSPQVGGSGGSGIDILNTLGGGGGSGGGAGSPAGGVTNTGLYGGGGGGGGVATIGLASSGAPGSQGVIFIVYSPNVSPISTSNSNMFLLF